MAWPDSYPPYAPQTKADCAFVQGHKEDSLRSCERSKAAHARVRRNGQLPKVITGPGRRAEQRFVASGKRRGAACLGRPDRALPTLPSRTVGEQSCRHAEGSAGIRGDTITPLTCGDKTSMDAGEHRETVVSALENRCGVDASPWVRIPHPPLSCTNAGLSAALTGLCTPAWPLK